MAELKSRFSDHPRKLEQHPVSFGLIFAAFAVLYELLFRSWTAFSLSPADLIVPACYSAGLALAGSLIIELLPGTSAKRWALMILNFLLAALYLTQFYILDAYHMFMTPALIFRGAQGVMTDYGDLVTGLLTGDLPRILLMLVPATLCAWILKPRAASRKFSAAIAAGAVSVVLIGTVSMNVIRGDLSFLKVNHNFEGAIRSLGLPTAVLQNLFADFSGAEDTFTFVEVPEHGKGFGWGIFKPESEPEPAEPPKVYEPNILPIDYHTLYSDSVITDYILAQEPTRQNEYTGMFAGKNLILITAEAFCAEVIDKDLTPTLYRMATQGIRFTDYYQPAWGGSTTSGEMSILFGLVPDCSGGMGQIVWQHPFITMGYQLGEENYFSMAFHNNTGSFYNRNGTHILLGYDQFISPDQGMKVTGRWPQSDLEMMIDTIPRYIDHQPFNVYYMTVSGHSVYKLDQHYPAEKNYDKVKDLPYCETVKCYLAANLELEYAMEELLRQLEEAGIADDTLIVISPDHYPYGLDESQTWGNSQNALTELFRLESTKELNDVVRDHSALIMWSGCLEGKNITVDTPACSLDILPTLSNLFGVPFESRLLVGRDVFSDREPLVLWPNYSWVTEEGAYLAATDTFIPRKGTGVDPQYLERIHAMVVNRINFSYAVQRSGYLYALRNALFT